MTKQRQVKLKWVALASLLNNTGAAFLWPLTTMYMHNYLHESLTTAGVVMLLMSICMMVGNYLGGWLFDHWDQYQTAVLGVTISTVAIFTLIFAHGWPWFAVLMMLNSLGDGINMTIVNSYGSLVSDHSSRYVFNYIYMAFNVGVVIGTLAVGVLLPVSVVLVFTVATVFYFLLALVVVFALKVRVPLPPKTPRSREKLASRSHQQALVLIWLILLNFVTIHLSYSLWESVMAVHMTNMGIPFYAYSLLWTLNGVLIIVGQPLVNKLSPYVRLSSQIMVGILIFASSFLLLIFARNLWAFVLDFVLLTIGEMASFAGLPAWIAQLTTVNEAGHYQGLLNIMMSIGRAIGPLYGGFVIDHGNYQELFISVFLLMTVTLGGVFAYLLRLRRLSDDSK
ncbi:MAG: MFS transporter [Limosilactobacillus oris]|uniref:MDR family MFS transporter n=1 Tax=Limosilactobacillus oris TaxID=1632 RepID=UPI0021B197B7|nr:MFS transporter [Limosilactobacillus oris]MCH3910765.1 MFS transporter [Limosilactobacillus oris]MCH3938017.1 MFS transporter [Limosilactobacillus oris]MCI1981079.1 MFS transporter [Limosilactobacillus oris]UXC66747.1 MFS transporter [Limosilactobacillus oris]